MAQKGLIYRVLVASPSDLVQERKIIPEVIHFWNSMHSWHEAAIMEPVLWETHARPEVGDRPQAIINKQLVEKCDILIGAFWTKLGTSTGVAQSGTVEEIEEFRKLNKPVLIYFSSAPVVPDSLDPEQYAALLNYKKQLREQGLYFEYETLAQLRELIHRHISAAVIELIKQDNAGQVRQAERPDERDTVAVSDEYAEIRIYKSDFESFVRRLNAEWSSERDSNPYGIAEGQLILNHALIEVLSFRARITDGGSDLVAILEGAAKGIRSLQRHQLYVDGGHSFRDFWEKGDAVIASLNGVASAIDKLLPT